MKKIYGLFSTNDGDGTRCTFITTGTKMELEYFQEITYGIIKHTYFVMGECEIEDGQYNDVETREWFIPMWASSVKCQVFPRFK